MTESESQQPGKPTGVTRRQLLNGAGGAAFGGIILGGAAGYFGGNASAGGGGGGGAKGEPITIGALVPVTGPGAPDGQEMLRGMRLAADEINAQGGVGGHQVNISVLDAKDQAPDVMTNAMRKFVSDQVAAVFSPFLTTTSIEIPIIGRASIPMLHANALQANIDAAIDGGFHNIFEVCPSEKWYGPGFVSVMDQLTKSGQFKPRNKTAAVVTATDGYSISIARGFRSEVQKLGWSVVMFDTYTSPQAEWGGTLGRVRNKNPDVLFQSDYYAGNEASLIKQFAQAPTQSLVYQQFAPSIPEYRELSGSASDGVLWATTTGTIFNDDVGKAFDKAYRAKYNREPGAANAGGQYDAVWMWAYAAGVAGDPFEYDAIGENLSKLVYRGVNGIYNMIEQACYSYPPQTDDPSLGMPLQTYQIQKGEQVMISPDPYTTGKFETPPWMK